MKEARASANEDGSVDWDAVVSVIQRAEFHRTDDIPDLARFVRFCAGGLHNPVVLVDVDAFLKSQRKVSELQASILGRLATLDYPPNVCVHWRAAVVKAMAMSRDVNRRGESKYFSAGDVALMSTTHKPFVLQSDEIMAKAHRGLRMRAVFDTSVPSPHFPIPDSVTPLLSPVSAAVLLRAKRSHKSMSQARRPR